MPSAANSSMSTNSRVSSLLSLRAAADTSTNRPPVGQQPQSTQGRVHHGLVNLAGHDDVAHSLRLEAADHAAELGDARPVEADHERASSGAAS